MLFRSVLLIFYPKEVDWIWISRENPNEVPNLEFQPPYVFKYLIWNPKDIHYWFELYLCHFSFSISLSLQFFLHFLLSFSVLSVVLDLSQVIPLAAYSNLWPLGLQERKCEHKLINCSFLMNSCNLNTITHELYRCACLCSVCGRERRSGGMGVLG